MQDELEKLHKTKSMREEELRKLEEKTALLERDVNRFKDREKHLRIVEMCKKKRPWIEFEEVKRNEEETREDFFSLLLSYLSTFPCPTSLPSPVLASYILVGRQI